MATRKFRVLLTGGALLAALSWTAIAQQPAAVAPTAAEATQAPHYKMLEKEMFVPAPMAFPFGLDVLEVYITTPGKHPLAVLSHGRPEDWQERAHITAWEQIQQAQWFARRGYVAMVVVRSGFGRSGGLQDSGYGRAVGGQDDTYSGCTAGYSSFLDTGDATAQDLRAVMKYAQGLPEVDPATIVGVGTSVAGFAQVSLSADPPPGLKAAINFSGGVGSDEGGHSCNLPVVVDSFRSLGKGARKHGNLPMLWIYAQNDRRFPPYMAQQFDAAYKKAGGVDQFVMAPPDGEDGHYIYMDVSAWSDTVEAFLKARNLLPLGDTVQPPADPPNVPMPAALKEKDAEMWSSFLLAPPYKTLIADENSTLMIAAGAFNQLLADRDANQLCKKGAQRNRCTIVARTPGVK
jgi:dienelactone hydrolase